MIQGSYFGEIDIIFKRKRQFTATTGEDTEIYYITRLEFGQVIEKEFPTIYAEMLKEAVEKDDRNQSAIENIRQYIKKSYEKYLKYKREEKRQERIIKRNSMSSSLIKF